MIRQSTSGDHLKTDCAKTLPRHSENLRFRTPTKLLFYFTVMVAFCFAIASQASGASRKDKRSFQADKNGNINLQQIDFIKHSVASSTSSLSASSDNPAEPAPSAEKLTAMDIFMDGIDALDMQNYKEAAILFERASAMEPQNLEFQYYVAVSYVRLKKNRKALEIFESLTERDPKLFFKAYFDIAAIYRDEKEYDKAILTLKNAEKIDPNNGRLFLEMGSTYKDSGHYDEALKCFSRAKQLDPKLHQISTYMTGATYLHTEQFEQAGKMFKKAVEIDPGTSLAENARQTIPRVEEAAWAHKPWYLLTNFSWGYDDNMARDPLDEISGGPVSGGTGKGDQYQVFLLRGAYKLLNMRKTEAGLGYTLYSIGYRDWTESNVTYQSPFAYFQADWDPVFFRFQYDFTYFYSGGKKQDINPPIYLTFGNNSHAQLRMQTFMPTISIREPYNFKTDINLIYQIKDYLDGLTSDSSRYAADVTQSYQIPDAQVFPRIGYRTTYEQSGDDPSTYSYHELTAGIAANLYWDIWGDLSFTYTRVHYPDFTPSGGRRDSTYTTVCTLKRYLMKRLQLSFTYIHLRNNSDYTSPSGEDPYSFKKNIYALEISYVF